MSDAQQPFPLKPERPIQRAARRAAPSGAIGIAHDRVDGRLKVTGRAQYAAEFPVPDVVHVYAVTSQIASGRILNIDSANAMQAPGVLAVLTHENAPKLAEAGTKVPDSPFAMPWVLQSDRVDHYGQYVAAVVAETFEQARDASRLIRINYLTEPAALSFATQIADGFVPEHFLGPDMKPVVERGDVAQGLAESDKVIDAVYVVPTLHNNPMEPHATLAVWNAGRLTVYESSQHVNGAQQTFAKAWGISPKSVRIISFFIGGGFGCKVPVWEHALLATMAAKHTGRPAKMSVPRRQMFAGVGYRPLTLHRMQIGARSDGSLLAIEHEIRTPTNKRREYIEAGGLATPMMYATPNLNVKHIAAEMNWPRGTIMRGPGVVPNLFALECAIDEMAAALHLDPIALRFKNEPVEDPESGKPWSSRNLVDCFRRGAEAFGWNRRKAAPGSMRAGRMRVGFGTAAATFPAKRAPCAARAQLNAEGRLRVQLAATDIGTGTYTTLTLIAADSLGVPVQRVAVEIGDSSLPPTPGSGGSHGAASYGTAVLAACRSILAQLVDFAVNDSRSVLNGLAPEEIGARDGALYAKGDFARRDAFADIIRRCNDGEEIEGDGKIAPEKEELAHSSHAFGAHFAEVRVDPATGELRVTRFVGAFACGRIVNPKTAISQLKGSIVMGLGMALMEASVMDERHGNFVNNDLAGYHVPVHRDIPDIGILMIGEQDEGNPLGVKGLGEIAMTGVAAAVANAVFNATGKRVRELPITLDKLI